MTITSVFNSVLMILGPAVVTYFAFELNHKEDGQKTFITAGLFNFGTQAVILSILALVAPIFITGDENASLVF